VKNKFFVLMMLTFLQMTAGLSCDCLSTSWDYIIVGDGTAGATLARELSNGNKNSVVVLEWGINRTSDPVVLSPDPLAYSDPLTYDPTYAVTPVVPLYFPNKAPQYFIYSDGRMWGGSSAHNGLFTVRGTPVIYNAWAAISGQPRWSYNNMLSLFLATEHYTPNGTTLDPAQRGTTGPLYITQSDYNTVLADAWANATVTATGTPFAEDYNNPAQGGDICVSAQQQWITPSPDSHRSFSANAFTPVGSIVDANGFGLNGRKLRIVSEALVDKVIFNKNTAIGVQYYVNGDVSKVVFLEAKKKVILCAGAPRTPGILERSGIGDAALLTSLGIPVIVDNPNVGEHLFNHYGANGTVLNASTTVTPFLEWFTDGGDGDNVRRMQNISLTPVPDLIATNGILLQPKSSGSVHIVDRNPTIYPRIDLNMFSDQPSAPNGGIAVPGSDAYYIAQYLRSLPGIVAAFGGGATLAAPTAGQLASDSALFDYMTTLVNMVVTYHAVGTTRMGQSAATAVVDGNLHVFGVNKLMVADVGIEPVIQDGNTAYAAYFIGLQAANIIQNGL
jgi:choline dehydrogenase-like flavoprotein